MIGGLALGTYSLIDYSIMQYQDINESRADALPSSISQLSISDFKNSYVKSKDSAIELLEKNRQYEQMLKIKKERIEALKREQKKRLLELKRKQELKRQSVSRGSQPIGETYIYEVTFYTANYESTGKNKGDSGYGLTASGTTVQEGRTVACPRNLKLGTKIHIEGFGYRICEDRGGAIKNRVLDVYVESLDKAIQLGRQKLKVTILN